MSAPTFAETDRHDGNWWNQQTRASRVDYVIGFCDGLDLGRDFSVWQGIKNGRMLDWTTKAYESYDHYTTTFMKHITYGQLIDGITSFYEDFRNRSIMLPDAIWLVLNQIAGTPQAEMDKMIESFRKNRGI